MSVCVRERVMNSNPTLPPRSDTSIKSIRFTEFVPVVLPPSLWLASLRSDALHLVSRLDDNADEC